MVAVGVRTARQSVPTPAVVFEEAEEVGEAMPWLEREAG
jgi:hypothetical protein